MKVYPIFQRCWLPLGNTSMAFVAVCLSGQVLAQAAPSSSADGVNAGNRAGAAKAPNDLATRPQLHREVRRGPVKPPHYPSNPQPPVPPRR